MATSNATGGLDHPTVVPENFEPDRTGGPDDRDAERGSGADGESADAATTDGSRN